MTISKAGVIGWPISHSKSPRLHGYWLKKYAISGAYEAVAAEPEAFEATIRRLAADGWRGTNVTIPHKEAALALADHASETARAIGAANTLVFRDGAVHADNTDGFGFIENLRDRVGHWDASRPAAVYGAGGASRAIVYGLLASGAEEIRLLNRTRARAEALRDQFGPKVRVLNWGEDASAIAEAGLIVNTTSLGMKGQPELAIDLSAARDDMVATDIVYTPLITPFLDAAQNRGLSVVDGLGMLIHQGRPGFQAWFGRMPEVDETLRAAMLAP